MVAIGGAMTSAAILSFGWANGFWDLFLANVIFGLGGGVAMPALMALAVSKGNRTDAMGSVMALLTMAHSMGMMMGSLLAGVTMDIYQLRQAFPFGSLIMMIGVGIFVVCTYPAPGRQEPNRF
jgi:MFS family permease